MLIHSAQQLLTLEGGPQRGGRLGSLEIIPDGAAVIRDELILAVGTTPDLLTTYPYEPRFNAAGKVVMPGFVDPHTHLIFMGNRALEFEMRLEGKTYMEIMEAGGGIVNTVKTTRQATIQELKQAALPRMETMLNHGTTTAEAKSGYGLEIHSEIAQLQAILELDAAHPLDLAPTFMGAHAVPPEYENNADGFTHEIVENMLPQVLDWWRTNAAGQPLPFVDVFCETGAFSLAQSRSILEAARQSGFPLKIHADEFDNLGGASLAVELGAVSADHLVKTSDADIAALGRSETVAVALPPTPFGLGQCEYTPAREILAAGGILAVASDLNPGTAWCGNMQFVIALSCRMLKLTVAEAIAAATINAAAAIGRESTIGSLEPGKLADLIILSGGDYRNLGYQFGSNQVERVMKRGQWVAINTF